MNEVIARESAFCLQGLQVPSWKTIFLQEECSAEWRKVPIFEGCVCVLPAPLLGTIVMRLGVPCIAFMVILPSVCAHSSGKTDLEMPFISENVRKDAPPHNYKCVFSCPQIGAWLDPSPCPLTRGKDGVQLMSCIGVGGELLPSFSEGCRKMFSAVI